MPNHTADQIETFVGTMNKFAKELVELDTNSVEFKNKKAEIIYLAKLLSYEES